MLKWFGSIITIDRSFYVIIEITQVFIFIRVLELASS